MVVVLLLCVTLGVGVWFSFTHRLPTEAERRPPLITHDSMCATYTYDGEVVRWYVMVDPDKGAQYIYNDHSWVATPRIGYTDTELTDVESYE